MRTPPCLLHVFPAIDTVYKQVVSCSTCRLTGTSDKGSVGVHLATTRAANLTVQAWMVHPSVDSRTQERFIFNLCGANFLLILLQI